MAETGDPGGREDAHRGAHPFRHRWNHNSEYYPALAGVVAGCDRVLDVGCGEGTLARYLSGEGHRVTGLDADASVLPGAGPGPSFTLGDAEDLPFPDESFDAVTMVAVLHHVDAPRALAEARRVLRPGGRLAVIDIARARGPRGAAAWVRYRWIHHVARRGTTHWEPGTRKVDPRLDGAATRRQLEAELPGAVVHRLPLWRYLAIWTAPT